MYSNSIPPSKLHTDFLYFCFSDYTSKVKIIDLSSDLAWQGNYFHSFLPLVAVTMLYSSSGKISSITFGTSAKPLVWKEDGGVLKLTSTGFAYNLPKLLIKLFNVDWAVSRYVNDVVWHLNTSTYVLVSLSHVFQISFVGRMQRTRPTQRTNSAQLYIKYTNRDSSSGESPNYIWKLLEHTFLIYGQGPSLWLLCQCLVITTACSGFMAKAR